MESLQLVSEPSEVLGGHLVSLSSGDVVHESGLIFAPESLAASVISDCNSDEMQTLMTVPVHMVQDSSYVVPLVLKNASGNTFLLDPRQCGLLSVETSDESQPQFIIAPGLETGDGDQSIASGAMGVDLDYSYVTNVGNLVLGESSTPYDSSADVNQSTILHLGSQVFQDASKLLPEGMCIDMSQLSIVTSNGVVSYVATPSVEGDVIFSENNNAAATQPNSCINVGNSTAAIEKENKTEGKELSPIGHTNIPLSVTQPVVKRRRGRPRKTDPHTEETIDPPVGKPPYRCDTCGFEAALWGRLKRHKQSHLNEKPHKCHLCPVSFNVEANLTLHTATHDQEQLKCPECNRVFTRVASLRSHLMLHEREDNLFCTECGDEFALQYQLDSHVMEHQEEWVKKNLEKVYECHICQRHFKRSSALKEHIREHIKVKQSLIRRKHDRTQDRSEFSQKCSNCGKVFRKPSQLLRHMRIHTGERPFSCDVCGKAFNQKGSLQIHMTKHNGEKPYQCEFCSARFSQKGNLRAHIQRVHSIPEQGAVTYRCSECPCIFRKLGSLNSHVGRAHSQVEGEKDLKSDALNPEQMMQVNVDQIMAQLAALEKAAGRNVDSSRDKEVESSGSGNKSQMSSASVRIDASDILQQAINKSGLEGRSDLDTDKEKVTAVTGYITLADKALDGTVRRYTIRQRKVGRVRWHQCSYCCKEFKKPSDLVRHIRIHTHEKPFKCPHCFRAFSVKSTLTSHIRTHGGLKQYSCVDCDKKFSSTSSLKVHQRLHNGERPFACSLCNRTFRTSGHRHSHWLSHCDEKGDEKGDEAVEHKKRKKRRDQKKEESDENLPEVLLQEPIVISEAGLIRPGMGNSKSDTDTAPRLHHCTQCNSAFRKSSHLKMHLRTHSGERPFQCSICNRSFVTNGVLKSHILTHQSVKAYTCSICSNTFSTHGSLKRHMYRHDENRPFMCPYCHKTFKHKMSCKKHMQIHKLELARAAAQQSKDMNEQQFVVSVEDGFNSSDIIVPNFSSFSEEPLSSNGTAVGPDNNGVQLQEDKLLPSGTVITHTLLADATGTITLPDTLTQESIREIEETLNRQLSSQGNGDTLISSCDQSSLGSLSVSTSVPTSAAANVIDISAASEAAHAEDVAAAANLAASENMQEEDLNSRSKGTGPGTTTTDLSSTIFSQTFDQQSYDACSFPSITLQGDQLTLTGMEQGATLSANMESILPQSCIGDRRRNIEITSENDEVNVDSGGLGIVEDLGEQLENLDAPGSEEHYISESCAEAQTDVPFITEASEADSKTESFVHDATGSTETNPNQSTTTCDLCNKNFKKASLLKSHLVAVHGTNVPSSNHKSHECAYCPRRFSSASGLRLHEWCHVREKSFVCEHCSLSFASSGSLARHMAIHRDKRPLSCSQCSATFRTQIQLSRHFKSHTDVTRTQRTCRKVPAIILSEEQTSALANQSVDMAGSVSERILIASALELNREVDLHEGKQTEHEPVYPNQCEFCTKSFRKPSDLVRHIRIHTGERPFRCNYCPKSFTVKSTLDAHQKTHISGLSKMFLCHVCNLRFSTKGSLKVHMRLHTGSKPFKCSTCNLRFRTSGHRKAHMLSHEHGGTTSRARKAQNQSSKGLNLRLGPEEHVQDTNDDIQQQPIITHQILTEDGSVVSVNAAALLTTESSVDGSHLQLQINESFLQQLQFQGGETGAIKPKESVQFEFATGENGINVADAGDLMTVQTQTKKSIDQHHPTQTVASHETLPSVVQTIQDIQTNQELQQSKHADSGNIPNMQFEIHTDEHGQIVNIQQTLDGRGVILADIGDLNLSDAEKVSIDASRLQILDGVEGMNVNGITGAVDGFVTLDISNIIVAPPVAKKRRGGKQRAGGNSDTPSSYPCSVCNKAFGKPSQLERHLRIHTGERPFPCPQCWKAFNQKNALMAHMKRHTGERPFRCPHCDHAFTQRGNLKTHIRRAHPHSTETGLVRKKRPISISKHIVDEVTLNLDLDGVVSDLFPQMHSTEDSEVV